MSEVPHIEPSRDKLALQRTQLANERTFLAYIRTALSLIAAAAVLFQFFSAVHAYKAVAWVLAIAGFLVLVIGVFRFRAMRAELGSGARDSESA